MSPSPQNHDTLLFKRCIPLVQPLVSVEPKHVCHSIRRLKFLIFRTQRPKAMHVVLALAEIFCSLEIKRTFHGSFMMGETFLEGAVLIK